MQSVQCTSFICTMYTEGGSALEEKKTEKSGNFPQVGDPPHLHKKNEIG